MSSHSGLAAEATEEIGSGEDDQHGEAEEKGGSPVSNMLLASPQSALAAQVGIAQDHELAPAYKTASVLQRGYTGWIECALRLIVKRPIFEVNLVAARTYA